VRARRESFLILEDSVMTHWWSASRQRGVSKLRALRASPRVEHLEERTLLTNSLVVVPSPFISGSRLVAATAIASNDSWAVGEIFTQSGPTQNLAEHFNGTSWSVVPTPALNAAFTSVAAVASTDVWAVGGPVFVVNTDSAFIEHWDGTSWSIISSPKLPNGSYLTGVTAPASNNVWAVGFNGKTSGALVEHWDGTSWSIVSSPAFTGVGGLNAVSADASNDVWAVGGTTSLHWNGQTWSQIAASSKVNAGAIWALSPTNVWAGGVGPGVPHPPFSAHPTETIEHWDGTSWAIAPSPDPNPQVSNFLSGIAAISAKDIWAVGDAAGAFTEHWDGTSWSVIATPKGVGDLNGVTALSNGTVVAVGEGTNGSAVILMNPGSAPKTAPLAAARAAPPSTAGRTPAAPTPTLPAALDAAAVDQLFATEAQAGQPGSLPDHRSGRPRRRRTPIGTAHRGHGVPGSGLIPPSGPESSSGPERDATGFTHHSNLLHRGHKPWLGCLAGF
jgi:hypothetical protein